MRLAFGSLMTKVKYGCYSRLRALLTSSPVREPVLQCSVLLCKGKPRSNGFGISRSKPRSRINDKPIRRAACNRGLLPPKDAAGFARSQAQELDHEFFAIGICRFAAGWVPARAWLSRQARCGAFGARAFRGGGGRGWGPALGGL